VGAGTDERTNEVDRQHTARGGTMSNSTNGDEPTYLTYTGEIGNASDGYHTFNQLYEFRLLYNAAMFNELYRTHQEYDIHKSWKHSDGELAFGGGWFVVVAQLPTGQITNHYEEKDWYLFDINEREQAADWDGHTPEDVATRLREYVQSYESRAKQEGRS
jgi:hypothetical protein